MQLTLRYKGSYISYVLTYFFFFFCMAVYSSILSVYLTGIGKTASELSLIISAANIFSLFMVPLTGYLNDITQKPKLISTVSLLSAGILGLVFSVSRQVWILFLLNGLIMSGINCVMPICERMAGACKFRYGSIRVWGTLGYASGAQIAGLIIDKTSASLIFVMFLLSAFITIAGFWGTEPMRPETARAEFPKKEDPSDAPKQKISGFLRNPVFLLFLLIAFVLNGASGVNMTYIPLLLKESGASTTLVGTVIFLSTLVEIPLILFSHKFMDRFRAKTLLSASFILMIVQFVCYGFAKNVVFIILVVVLFKAIASTLFVMTNLKVVRNIISPAFISTGLSIVNSVNSFGAICLQNAGGWVADTGGIPVLYFVLAALAVTGLILTQFLRISNQEKVFNTN